MRPEGLKKLGTAPSGGGVVWVGSKTSGRREADHPRLFRPVLPLLIKTAIAPALLFVLLLPRALPGEELINRREQARKAFQATPQGLYQHYCAHCHGENAAGAGRLWVADLPAEPPDLTSLGKDKQYVAEVIREGSTVHAKSNLCPPWERTLSAANVERLAQYVALVGETDSPTTAETPPAAPAAGEPVPWLLLAAVLGEGALLWILLRRKKETFNVVSQDPAVRG